MKKLISIFLLVAMLISVIPCVALSVAAEGETTAITPDTSWWDNKTEGQTTFEISTAEQLLGFAKIMSEKSRPFYGSTVKLTADIDLNPGWDAYNFTEAPANVWPQVEQDNCLIFDGQGHIVRGVYQVSDTAQKSGIFGRTWSRATEIKNVRFENCYSESSNPEGHGFLYGAITNGTAVTIENVYVNARIVNTGVGNKVDGVGGLIGTVTYNASTTLTMTNTVFAGSIEVEPTDTTTFMVLGGLVGLTNILSVEFDNCASYATFVNNDTSKTPTMVVGGFIGIQWNTTATPVPATVQNCVSDCTLTNISKNAFGSIIGGGRINNSDYSYVNGTGNVATSERAIGCCWNNSTKVADTEGTNYNAVCNGSNITVTKDADISDNFATVLHGYQAKDAADNKFDFRLVATVDIPENVTVDKVGFIITATYGDTRLTKNYSTNTVYNSVTGNTDTGLKEYTAEALGGDYIFALAITGAPTNKGDITLEVTTYYVSGTTTVYGAPEVFTVTAPQDALN